MKYKGFIVAAVHLAIVMSLAAKYQMDRQNLPHVWARALPFDPNLPIRGRYVRMLLRVENPEISDGLTPVRLSATSDGKLTATRNPEGDPALHVRPALEGESVLSQPVAYFIPEHIPDPSIRQKGEELWVEVTIPRKGPPRPIRLGIRKDGVLRPLEIN